MFGRRRPAQAPPEPLAALSPADRAIAERALPHTMTGVPRLQALIDAVRWIAARELPGDLAECGVWRGGSVLATLLTLADAGAPPRDVWLYDTFSGMTEPTELDVSPLEPPALETWRDARAMGAQPWGDFLGDDFGEERVRATLLDGTGYPAERLHLVRGPVEETIPAHVPERLALLRLDTDWHASTRHELEHLYPRLVPGGVLIVDDYGHWDGARRAVDEYFAAHPPAPLLHRIDYTGRIAVKP